MNLEAVTSLDQLYGYEYTKFGKNLFKLKFIDEDKDLSIEEFFDLKVKDPSSICMNHVCTEIIQSAPLTKFPSGELALTKDNEKEFDKSTLRCWLGNDKEDTFLIIYIQQSFLSQGYGYIYLRSFIKFDIIENLRKINPEELNDNELTFIDKYENLMFSREFKCTSIDYSDGFNRNDEKLLLVPINYNSKFQIIREAIEIKGNEWKRFTYSLDDIALKASTTSKVIQRFFSFSEKIKINDFTLDYKLSLEVPTMGVLSSPIVGSKSRGVKRSDNSIPLIVKISFSENIFLKKFSYLEIINYTLQMTSKWLFTISGIVKPTALASVCENIWGVENVCYIEDLPKLISLLAECYFKKVIKKPLVAKIYRKEPKDEQN